MNKIVSSSIVVILVFSVLFLPPTTAHTEAYEFKDAEMLGLTPSEFEKLSTSIHEYLYEKYPFLRDTEFGISYEKVDTKIEGIPPESLVIDAYANFRTPPVVVRAVIYNEDMQIISEKAIEETGDIKTLDLNRTIEEAIQIQETVEVERREVEIDGDPDPEFIIYWRYSDFPNNSRADEVVDMVETAARISWNTICGQWGFDEPPDDDGGVDIYINDNVHEWGPYAPYGDATGTFRWKNGTDQIIYIHHTRQQTWKDGYNVEWPTEQDCFTAGISHEFFHCIQDAYNVLSCGMWVYEGTARFIPSALNPDAAFYYPQSSTKRSLYIRNATTYLQDPGETLSDKSYDACIFWRYVYEHYGGIDTIERIFEQIETDSPITFNDELNSINTTLVNQESITIGEVFAGFSRANILEFAPYPYARDDEFYQYSDRYYEDVYIEDVHIDATTIFPYSFNAHGIGDGSVEEYATDYYSITSDGVENINILFNGEDTTTDFVVRVLKITGANVEEHTINLNAQNDGSFVIRNADTFDSIMV